MNAVLKLIILTIFFAYGVHIFAENVSTVLPQQAITETDPTLDQAITKTLQTKITNDPTLQGTTIATTTFNGVVTLTGQVQKKKQIVQAIKLAKSTAGVTKVISKLTISK